MHVCMHEGYYLASRDAWTAEEKRDVNVRFVWVLLGCTHAPLALLVPVVGRVDHKRLLCNLHIKGGEERQEKNERKRKK